MLTFLGVGATFIQGGTSIPESRTNPKYDKRLFIELQVQYMKIASSEYVVDNICSECQNKNKKPICVHNIF